MNYIFHIDMDSFFATVEQQANPLLRGKPIVVSGKEGSRSVIVASSKEAKRFGVKTGMLHKESRQYCPNLIFVEPDGDKYNYFHHEFIKIFKKFTDKVEVFSIDEAFLDMTGFVKSDKEAEIIGQKIKVLIKQNLGEWITCSVGVAENKLLAKLASEMKKPDGFFIINCKNLNQVLTSIKLTDFCGIGLRLEQRLLNLGVNTIKKLQEYPLSILVEEFGCSLGNRLKEMSFGRDESVVIPDNKAEKIKSVGRSHTISHDSWNKEKILTVLLHLCEKVGYELRRKNMQGKTVVIYFRYTDFEYVSFRLTLSGYTDDTLKIFEIGFNKLQSFQFKKAVRLVGIHVSNLMQGVKQQKLWELDRKRQKLNKYYDKINDKYGELTVKPAYLLKLKRLRKKVGGFKP